MCKKAWATTLICLVAAAILFAALTALPERLAFRGAESYSFYLGDSSKNCRVVTADGDAAFLTRLALRGVDGESATYSSLDLDAFLSEVNGEILFCEELSDSVNYYCKADLPYSVVLYGQEVNLHVCVKENATIVATPVIFGGY